MKKLNKILFTLALLLLPLMVSAKVVEADGTLNLEGAFDSSKFLFGNMIDNSADINGIAVIAGNSIKTSGKAQYGFYAGNDVTIAGETEGDLFVAGNTITITAEAVTPRDVYLAASKIKIDTTIGRDLYAGAEEVDLRGITVKGNAYVDADKILVDENTVVEGKLSYYEKAKIENLDKATVGSTDKIEHTEINISAKERRKARIKSEVMSVLIAFVTMLVIFLLFPKFRLALEKAEEGAGAVALTALTGLAVTICTPVVAIIAMITVLLIPIALMTLAGYLGALYLASLVAYYVVAHKLYAKISEKSIWYVELLLGIILFKLISYIPYAGGIVLFICFIYGMGRLFNLLKGSFGKTK